MEDAMTQYIEFGGAVFVVGETVDERFEEFQELVEEYGLSTFVSFIMFKHFAHSSLDGLNNNEKEILIDECQPLICEALIQGRAM
jgi:hypothetical protein